MEYRVPEFVAGQGIRFYGQEAKNFKILVASVRRIERMVRKGFDLARILPTMIP